MAFFDDLGKKISQTGQDAVLKTKNFAEIQKLNSQISEEEKQIGQLYAQIGSTYVRMHVNSPEAEQQASVRAVLEATKRIEQYKKDIAQIKGVRSCPKCGAEVPINSSFCSLCGEKMPMPEPQKMTAPASQICGSCGAVVPAGQKFCTQCGSQMGQSSAVQQQAASAVKICPKCGKQVGAEFAFCTECGAAL